MPRRCTLILGSAMLWAFADIVHAQDDVDLTLPPRLDEAPGQTRLAAPAPARREAIEEVIVISESEWRLPDLGSTWRAQQEAAQVPQRIELAFLPLYDPERESPDFDPLRLNREVHRVGFIELFRVRFGGRSRD